jgi:hypothetical protein
MSITRKCGVCDRELIEDDGFWSCPVYTGNVENDTPESNETDHTSYPMSPEELE